MISGRKPNQALPPSNVQAEQTLFDALLANIHAYERVLILLSPLPDPFDGRIFLAIAHPTEGGKFADAVTLKAEFEHSAILEEVGRHGDLVAVTDGCDLLSVLGSRSRCRWP